MTELPYGFAENVAQGLNLSPSDAERAIREAYEIAGGRAPFDGFTRESRRLRERFPSPEEMATDAELMLLTKLARRADSKGMVLASRDELADAMEWPHRQLGNALTWGVWRDSFAVRRTSAKGAPPAYCIELSRWLPSRDASSLG